MPGPRPGHCHDGCGVGVGGDLLGRFSPGLPEDPALVLGRCAPDPGLLVGLEGKLQTGVLCRALVADLLGGLDHFEGESGASDREEQICVRVAAQCALAPVLGIPVVCSYPGEGHAASNCITTCKVREVDRAHVHESLRCPCWGSGKSNKARKLVHRSARGVTCLFANSFGG